LLRVAFQRCNGSVFDEIVHHRLESLLVYGAHPLGPDRYPTHFDREERKEREEREERDEIEWRRHRESREE
jgi:hypothetical protein